MVAALSSVAQPQRTVHGSVFDSVAGKPLAEAIIQVVELDSTSHFTARAWWGTTDTKGAFTIGGLPEGRFAFGFQHPALVTLGLQSPVRVIDVAGDSAVRIDLAIPSGAVVRAQNCGTPQGVARDGMLVGYVHDAATDALLDSVTVDVHWLEIETVGGGYRTVPHRVALLTKDDGRFQACGLPEGTAVNVTVTRDAYRSVDGEISLTSAGVGQRDFRLASNHIDRGPATVEGRVLTSDSTRVGSGHVRIPALDRDAPIADGRFSLAGLPLGTWAIETQVIGFEPERALVDALAPTSPSPTIVLKQKAQPLDAITVIGKPNVAESRKLAEILDRKRVGFGTMFMPGDERLAHATSLFDLASLAGGFHIGMGHSNEFIEGRVVSGPHGVPMRCRPDLIVDGFRVDTLNLPMQDVLAVAMYPDIMGVPVQYRRPGTYCAILVWTKH